MEKRKMNLERKFSKELAGDLRKETADKLKEVKNNPDSFKDLKNKIGKEELPEEYSNLKKYIRYIERRGDEEYFKFGEEFEKQKKAILGKIFKTEKYRRRELFLSESLEEKKESDIRKIRNNYEDKFFKILEDSPLTLEERKKYLSTENMEKMNLQDYLTLLKRLSGEAFYHVTRYGVRENTFMSTGGGHEYGKGMLLDNLTPLLKDKSIKSATSTILESKGKNVAEKFVSNDVVENIKKGNLSVDEALDTLLEKYDTDFFLDRETTHFTYGINRHDMYGAEDDYEFYFYYPVEYIMQNDYYHSNRQGLTIGAGRARNDEGIYQQHNDAQIFNFGEGVPINAGIFYVTGDVKVDPETGSQYLLKNGKPLKDDDGSFKKPEKTISSKEYWEKYFEENPELKPNKTVYHCSNETNIEDFFRELDKYHGVREYLIDWAKEKEIFKQSPEKRKEFEDYVNLTREKIRDVFKEIIEEKLNESEN
ncbi:MAG: hypothetical protein U9R00_01125 [Patescibacteria group bacterium]|nr:hypothetical protein [Patescibacteria group bacterium]